MRTLTSEYLVFPPSLGLVVFRHSLPFSSIVCLKGSTTFTIPGLLAAQPMSWPFEAL